MSVPFHYSNGTLTLYLKGEAFSVGVDHPCYGQIKKSLKSGTEEDFLRLLDVDKAVKTFVDTASHDGKAEVIDGEVYYDGKVVHNAVATRIVELMRAGLDFSNMLRFLERVSKNPSYQSQKELFDFLDRKGLPITEDGCFLGYKAVRHDFKDKWSGKIDNSPGQLVKMDRGKVNDNREHHCSAGLHVGAMEYVMWYGHSGDRVVVVKVDPEHCVSVPTDCDFKKLRTCQYEVLHEFTGKLENALYTTKGEPVADVTDDDEFDWSFCDEEDIEIVDDQFEDGDVTSVLVVDMANEPVDIQVSDEVEVDEDEDDEPIKYGIKPPGSSQAGRKFFNERDKSGRFHKVNK